LKLRTLPVRFRILGVLFVLSFVNYLLRNNLSVAVPSLRQEFGFSSVEIGWILGSFNISYGLLQIPGGIFGERLGPRRALGIIAVTWGLLTWLTGFAPSLMAASAMGALVALIVVRGLLGAANAPIFPTIAGSVESWFPPGSWAFPNAVSSTGLSLGQAAIGPVVTFLIVQYGWRESCYLLAPLGILSGLWWYGYARDKPAEHRAITPQEIARIDLGRATVEASASHATLWKVLRQRDVLLLAVSYFCLNFVFYMFSQWLFTYLVEARGFSILESGFLYALPFVAGALLSLAGGLVCDNLCQRLGPRSGCRVTAISGLTLVAAFLLAGVYATDPYVAVALLALCFGFTLFTDTVYWAATTYAAGPHTASATGVLNMGGTSAGFLAPAIGWMIDHVGWVPTIASGSAFALVGAALWLFVRVHAQPLPRGQGLS
jgi:ACS family glucarate transporter-like MFS transporter